MSLEVDRIDETAMPALRVPGLHRTARASIRMSLGNAKIQADAEITPMGLLAIGGMVGAILLAVGPIVAAARRKQTRK